MGTTFKKLYNKLIGSINVVPASFAKEAINEALRDIYDARDWGFLWTDGYIRIPALIEGTVEVTKFSEKITFSGATKALIDAITVDEVPLEERQLKFYGTNKINKVFYYKILDYDSDTGDMLIDPPYLDDSNAAIKVQILKVYYTAPYYQIATVETVVDGDEETTIVKRTDPVIDFRRFAYIVSPEDNRRLITDMTLDEVNRRDPSRNELSYPRYFIPYGIDSAGNQLYEFYPASRSEKIYQIKYLRNGVPLINDSDTIPDLIPTELVLARAKQKAYEWVQANAGILPSVKNVGVYSNLIAMLDNPNRSSSYPSLLDKAIRRDEELFPQAYVGDFSNYNYYDDYWGDYNWELTHDRFGETLVIDANA